MVELWGSDLGQKLTSFHPVADVRRVTSMFGVDFFPDEGLMNHSLQTAVIDRRGRIRAAIEGNLYTPEQLGDLVLEQLRN